MIALRPYQREAIDALYNWFGENDGNPLIVLPTGTGKSVVIAEIIRSAVEGWPDTRILMVTHVKELIGQNFAELLTLWPQAPAGINSAGLRQRNTQAQILFCGIQSVYKKAFDIQRCDLLLIDEAHLVPDDGTTMYRKFIDDLRVINPQMKVIGLTATPYRMSHGMLHMGKNRLFHGIAYEYDLLTAVQEGYLSPLVSKHMEAEFDLSGVGTRGGEFIPGQLEAAVNQDPITKAAVAEMVRYGQDRRMWLVFASGVKHAEAVATEIFNHGIVVDVVLGDTPSAERDAIIKAYRAGEIRCLVSVGVLTTGFNVPGVDLIGMMRATKSTGLYVQMAGRGTRLADGKRDCLVLDFAGNVARHGPVDRVRGKRGPGETEGEGDAPVKTCPECQSICFAGLRECPDCGYIFPPPKPKIERTATTEAILSDGQPQWVPVDRVFYARHEKPGKPPTLRVEYACGLRSHREWIGLEGNGRQRAVSWWNRRTKAPVPMTVDEALAVANVLAVPKEIAVRPVGRYTEIVGVRFE